MKNLGLGNKTYYEKGNVKVTSAQFVTGDQTFAIRDIISSNVCWNDPMGSRLGSAAVMFVSFMLLQWHPILALIIFGIALKTYTSQKESVSVKVIMSEGEITALKAEGSEDYDEFLAISIAIDESVADASVADSTEQNKSDEGMRRHAITNIISLIGDAEVLLHEKSYSDIEKSFREYGVTSIWHMTHKDNIKEILRSGILSHNDAHESKRPTDISNLSVQKRRESEDPIYGQSLHDYAPTYINIKNPMLYVKREIQHELCLIEISLSALSEQNFIFTDGNAAASDTRFYNTTDDLDKLPWDVLNASYWTDFADGKRKRCSEVLVYQKIDPRHIIKLHCCSYETRNYASRFGVPVELSEELFFETSSHRATPPFTRFDDHGDYAPF
ncbi:MAG TPA: hypothetical protein DEP36_06015 [Gammaproteobacteria bacterium]|nr:hypothetical protein [Gammaproteobacteria bacterium]